MAPSERTQHTAEAPPAATGGSADEETGLPGLRSWRAVYVVVLASFVLWVGLLFALGVLFR